MIVYTGGTFDLLHAGHVDFLRVCKTIAGSGKVVVALNRDSFVEKFKGKPPVCSFDERKDVLEACRYVDQVIVNMGDADSTQAIKSVNPSFIVIGDDWMGRDYYKQMGFTSEWLVSRGITLLYVARHRVLSSTAIKARVNDL